jgi:hypothetical protein
MGDAKATVKMAARRAARRAARWAARRAAWRAARRAARMAASQEVTMLDARLAVMMKEYAVSVVVAETCMWDPSK